ncbi:MAG: 50S ribosomal protein L35 [Pseudomonadota bacterium]
MSKLKTRRAAAKRFGFTGTGKIRRTKANHRHNLTHQAQKVKVQHRRSTIVADGDAVLIKKMLPHG